MCLRSLRLLHTHYFCIWAISAHLCLVLVTDRKSVDRFLLILCAAGCLAVPWYLSGSPSRLNTCARTGRWSMPGPLTRGTPLSGPLAGFEPSAMICRSWRVSSQQRPRPCTRPAADHCSDILDARAEVTAPRHTRTGNTASWLSGHCGPGAVSLRRTARTCGPVGTPLLRSLDTADPSNHGRWTIRGRGAHAPRRDGGRSCRSKHGYARRSPPDSRPRNGCREGQLPRTSPCR